MSRRKTDLETSLPLELKLRVLEAELDRVESDLQVLHQRKQEVEAEIAEFRTRLDQIRRRSTLRRVK